MMINSYRIREQVFPSQEAIRFHENHSNNVIIDDKRTVASRTDGYGHGVVFSERNLYPGEFYVIEIEQNDISWLGYLRLGLTQVDPINYVSNYHVHSQETFDLKQLGKTWLYAVTELLFTWDDDNVPVIALTPLPSPQPSWPYVVDEKKVHVCEDFIRTCFGSYVRKPLSYMPENIDSNCFLLKVGFKIGVFYIPDSENFAELYYVVNGNVFGPYATDIPYRKSPLFAVADVYGKTKKIRVLPLPLERTLKQLCRMAILQNFSIQKINNLNLPKSILDYLNFNPATWIM